MDTARTTWQHTLRDRVRREASDRGARSIQETDQNKRGQTILDPAGVTPSRRLGTLVEKRTHWSKDTKSLMEGEGQARSLGNSRPNHRYSKVVHLRHLAKPQRKPGEDRVLASTVTSQVKARSPATKSHNKPTEDVGK